MIQKVRKGEELNEINIKGYLFKNKFISDTNSELNIKQFSNGFSNLTYLHIPKAFWALIDYERLFRR